MIHNPTPSAAIKNHCTACCGDSHAERKLCPAESCPLHAWRNGKKPPDAKLSALKTIKAHCKKCGEDPPSKCSMKDCHLFPFRTGRSRRKPMTKEQKDRAKESLKAVRKRAVSGAVVSAVA